MIGVTTTASASTIGATTGRRSGTPTTGVTPRRATTVRAAAGATVAAGGVLPADHADQAKDGPGVPQFYPPTIVLLPSILTDPSLRDLVSEP